MDSLLLWKIKVVLEEVTSRIPHQKEVQSDLLPEHNISIHALCGLEWQNATLVFTNGLSNKTMAVPKGLEEKANTELFFLLSSDFDADSWTFKGMDLKLVLNKMANLVLEKNSWLGAGHTFPNVTDQPSISIFTEMDHFMLIEPLIFQEELGSIKKNERPITFLAVIPIYKKELDYKLKNGAFTLMKRLRKNDISEYFEMKRPMVLKRKFFGL